MVWPPHYRPAQPCSSVASRPEKNRRPGPALPAPSPSGCTRPGLPVGLFSYYRIRSTRILSIAASKLATVVAPLLINIRLILPDPVSSSVAMFGGARPVPSSPPVGLVLNSDRGITTVCQPSVVKLDTLPSGLRQGS